MTPVIPHYTGGCRTDLAGGPALPVHDPATGSVTASVTVADEGTVDAAVQCAVDAFPAWRDTPVSRRTGVLFAFREILRVHEHELAELVSAEHGKVRADALGEVRRGIEVVEHLCGLGELLKGDRSDEVSTGVDATTTRQALGVAVGITPFNFPVMVPLWMFPVAVACGNTFVLKPSEKDPSAPLRLAELFGEAGLPPGVLNVVNGGAGTVEALLGHPGVDAVSFVGSTPVARHVHRAAVAGGKRVQALGGAKNHLVVMPDADVDHVADALVGAAYGSAGERCMAVSVAVVVGDVAERLVGALVERVGRLRVGPGLADPPADMGPLVTAEHRDRVRDLVDAGVEEGAVPVVDGRLVEVEGHPGGFWLGPTLFDDVTPDMRVYREEIFGPVLCVVRVGDLGEALEVVNSGPFGNGASVFTRDGGAARRFRREVRAGMVGVNVAIPVPMAYHSFGGWKDSLFGDVHVHGPEGVRFYTRNKVVTERWPEGADGIDLAFGADRAT